jgi:hypothetical protein
MGTQLAADGFPSTSQMPDGMLKPVFQKLDRSAMSASIPDLFPDLQLELL